MKMSTGLVSLALGTPSTVQASSSSSPNSRSDSSPTRRRRPRQPTIRGAAFAVPGRAKRFAARVSAPRSSSATQPIPHAPRDPARLRFTRSASVPMERSTTPNCAVPGTVSAWPQINPSSHALMNSHGSPAPAHLARCVRSTMEAVVDLVAPVCGRLALARRPTSGRGSPPPTQPGLATPLATTPGPADRCLKRTEMQAES